MEILQEIGSYAGLAAVLGLAVLSVLYFSQARDVKRLREWAGRAPERTHAPPQPRGVVAQPIARPAQPATPVPRAPGAQGAPARAVAAGAAPAVAHGPAPATPAAGRALEGGDEDDVTALDTAEHPAPSPPGDDPGAGGPETASAGESANGDAGDRDGLDAPTEIHAAAPAEAPEADSTEWNARADEDDEGSDDQHEDAYDSEGAGDEHDAYASEEEGDNDAAPDDADGPYDDGGDTGEWHPEHEHSQIPLPDEPAVPPATRAGAVRPPRPPRPYQRPRPLGSRPLGEGDRILPPYEETQAGAGPATPAHDGRGRRRLLGIAALVGVLVVGAIVITQLGGGGDSSAPDDAGIAAQDDDQSTGASDTPAIDPATVTVAVLNGTTIPGLAAQLGDQISSLGFQLGTVTNDSDQTRSESVVLYSDGAEAEAAAVGRELDIGQRELADATSQTLAGDASVIVVAGADQAQ